MGIHISIENVDGNLPEWDFTRYAGDRRVPRILFEGDVEPHPDNDQDCYMWRPTNIDAFEQRLLSKIVSNKDRWKLMAKLLRQSDDNWLFFSY